VAEELVGAVDEVNNHLGARVQHDVLWRSWDDQAPFDGSEHLRPSTAGTQP